MSITSQQLDSLIPCEDTTLNFDDLKLSDLPALTTIDISSFDLSGLNTINYTPSSAYGNITYTNIAPLTTADIVVLGGTGGSRSSYTINTINSGSGGSGSYTYGSTSTSFTWHQPEEWVETFPNFTRIQDMCKKYPALKIAYDKLVTTYKMVKDDYDNPENKK